MKKKEKLKWRNENDWKWNNVSKMAEINNQMKEKCGKKM